MTAHEWGVFLQAHPIESALAAVGFNVMALFALRALLSRGKRP